MTVGLRRSMVVVDYLGGVGLWTWNLRFAGLAFGVCLEMRFRRFFFFLEVGLILACGDVEVFGL